MLHTVISPVPLVCPYCREVFGCNGASTARAGLGGMELVVLLLQKKKY